MSPRPLLCCAVLLAASLSTGCAAKRIEECNALIGVINDEQAALKAPPSQEPAELDKLAARLDETQSRVGNVAVTVGELRAQRDDYQALVADIAAVLRSAAKALRDKDRVKLDEARERERDVGEREDALVDAINRFCAGN